MPDSESEPRALAVALTGEELPVTETDLDGLVAELEALGWGPERLRTLRADRMRARLPWPFPVPPAALGGLGFARFWSRLQELRALLGLDGQVQVAPSQPRTPDADESRLLAEKPPHWG